MSGQSAAGSEERADENALQDSGEALYRQVHPSWVQDEIPSSLAFRPSKKDGGRLSVALSSKIDAQAAYIHHTQVLGLDSAGTWAVTVGDVHAVALQAYGQPLPDSPAHGFIDFAGLTRSQAEIKAKLLAARARARGRLS